MKPLVYKKSRRAPEPREPERHKLHIAKGDTVRVISGEHRGKEGKVLRVFPKEFRVEAEGVQVDPIVFTPHEWLRSAPYLSAASGWTLNDLAAFRQRWSA